MTWIKAHPLRTLWIALGAVPGFLIGALALGIWTSGAAAAAIVGGIVGALMYAVLSGFQQISAVRGRAWARVLLVILIALPFVLAGGVLAVRESQLYAFGVYEPREGESRLETFDRLWAAMRDAYPYFELKGVDWEAARAEYRPKVADGGEDAFFAAVRDMLADLRDGHTKLYVPSAFESAIPFASIRDTVDGPVVTRVGASAAANGLEIGDIILQVEGLSVDEWIDTFDPRLRSGSTPWHRRYNALSNLLASTPLHETLRVTVEKASGETESLALAVVSAPNPPEEFIPEAADAIVWGRLLESGFGYIRVPQLYNQGDHDIVSEFDAALDSLMDVPGIIIDLRGNGGGSSALGDAMAGRLLSDPFTYGRDLFRARLPQRLWSAEFAYSVSLRAPRYTGEIVVLIDAGTVSSAENLLTALVDSGRVRTVGRVTAGSCGNPIRFELGGGWLRFSTGDFRRVDGSRVEGVGFVPDVPVEWTAEDVREGRDPDIAAAEALLSAE